MSTLVAACPSCGQENVVLELERDVQAGDKLTCVESEEVQKRADMRCGHCGDPVRGGRLAVGSHHEL